VGQPDQGDRDGGVVIRRVSRIVTSVAGLVDDLA
jgi:hypothetical protein